MLDDSQLRIAECGGQMQKVGWVEPGETQLLPTPVLGFARLNPTYTLNAAITFKCPPTVRG